MTSYDKGMTHDDMIG